MSLSDCPKCWDTPCTCGYNYKTYPDDALVKTIYEMMNYHDKNVIINKLVKHHENIVSLNSKKEKSEGGVKNESSSSGMDS